MQRVFVLSPERTPLSPCRPARARWLLTHQKAAVFRRYPFTIILKHAPLDAVVPVLRVKIDPGSTATGMAVVNDGTGEVVWAAELAHRGRHVKANLDQRRSCRRSRRQRHTGYRPPRFDNRTRPTGWLPPSLVSRIQNVVTWVERVRRCAPIAAISFELVRFDMQLIEQPDITGIAYQKGTLAGWEVREYLLLKWEYRCAYCQKQATRWEVDHITPRGRGGSNRVKNLALACHECNQEKGDQTAAEYGHPDGQAEAGKPLKDAAAVNSTRWALYERLKQMGVPIETGTGGRTKCNRTTRGIPKTHWLDAACAGASTPARLRWQEVVPLLITAQGWQRRQMCLVDSYGFPRTKAKGASRVFGFKTGDIVKAIVPSGKPQGTHTGKVAIKASGNFTITTRQRAVPDVPYRYCRRLHRADGYAYQKGASALLPHP